MKKIELETTTADGGLATYLKKALTTANIDE